MQTVVELPEYLGQVAKLLTEEEREAIKEYLGNDPKAGSIIRGTRAYERSGGSGRTVARAVGYRVIYFYHDESIPVFLLTAYGKNVKDNLSKSERNTLARVAECLKNYGGKDHE